MMKCKTRGIYINNNFFNFNQDLYLNVFLLTIYVRMFLYALINGKKLSLAVNCLDLLFKVKFHQVSYEILKISSRK